MPHVRKGICVNSFILFKINSVCRVYQSNVELYRVELSNFSVVSGKSKPKFEMIHTQAKILSQHKKHSLKFIGIILHLQLKYNLRAAQITSHLSVELP